LAAGGHFEEKKWRNANENEFLTSKVQFLSEMANKFQTSKMAASGHFETNIKVAF
jgi:hypothetical protein